MENAYILRVFSITAKIEADPCMDTQLTSNKLKCKIPINWILQWKDRGAVVISSSGVKVFRKRLAGVKGAVAEDGMAANSRLVVQIRSVWLSHCAESYVLIADKPVSLLRKGDSEFYDFSQPMRLSIGWFIFPVLQ